MYRVGTFIRILSMWLVILATSAALTAQTQVKPNFTDLEYVRRDGTPLKLDLYLPKEQPNPSPCVLFIHGGGWKNGNKQSAAGNAAWLTDHGFAVASVEYRLTDAAQWPAQIDDCYAAVRWLRTNADEYGIASGRIGAWGTSAGGHLAILLGTRPNQDDETVSSRVQAVCDWFGPAELMSMPPNNVGAGRTAEDVAGSNGAKLLGATVRDVPRLASDASGIDHVSSDDPAFLIMHGSEDPGVPLSQSQDLHAKLVRAGVPSRLHVLEGAKHGGKEFKTPASRQVVLDFFQQTLLQNWNQGSGPSADFVADGEVPTHWSVVRDRNVAWRKSLPETGQSTVVSWGSNIFFTTMKPVQGDRQLGSDIIAWCCDLETGETLWQREIPASHPLRLSGCFSDSTAPPPVVDGSHVCFFNASGRIVCFDMQGKEVWQRDLMTVGRSQPTIVDGKVVFIRQTYMPDPGGNFTHENKDAPVSKWTQLQAIGLDTGEDVWSTSCGVNMGCVPLLQTRSDGRRVFVVGRGGGHSPPEKPEGISMVDATDGSTIWTLPLKKFMSTMSFHLHGDDVLVFDGPDHLWVDAMTGKIKRRESIMQEVKLCQHSETSWESRTVSVEPSKKAREIIQQSNVLVGDYHYFRSYTQPWLGRVNVDSGIVEYLQLPVQLRAESDSNAAELLWGWRGMDPELVAKLLKQNKKAVNTLPITQWAYAPNDMLNSRGYRVVGDDRSMGNGWGHHASQIPTVIGKHLYVPTMAGTVYVIRWDVDWLNQEAIVSINDLGEVGKAWNRASLSSTQGKLLAHTIRELICIESVKDQ